MSGKIATIYETSKHIYDCSLYGDGLHSRKINFRSNNINDRRIISIKPEQEYQEIFGFGGAFTDAAIENILSMPLEQQEEVLKAYYGPSGNNYSTGRIPIGSCDFSKEYYCYCDTEEDFKLLSFSLNKTWDLEKRIPIIKRANALRGTSLRLFASPWTAPPWMKTNYSPQNVGADRGWVGGQLKSDNNGKYKQAWALYFSKYLSAYRDQGVDIWAVTVQNEPNGREFKLPTGDIGITWESMDFSAEQERDFVANYLGPTLKKEHPNVDIIMLDGQKIYTGGSPDWKSLSKEWLHKLENHATNVSDVNWPEIMLNGSDSAKDYVQGIGVHWYAGPFFEQLEKTHSQFPDKFILATEACTGYRRPFEKCGPDLNQGRWERGKAYAYDIWGDLTNWAVGWTDWNLVLDAEGGPNHANNFCDAPILVMPEYDSNRYRIIKQPMYYAIGHFSRFIPPGSKRIGIGDGLAIEVVAFKTPHNEIVVVVLNRGNWPYQYAISDLTSNSERVNISIPSNAFQTIVYPL